MTTGRQKNRTRSPIPNSPIGEAGFRAMQVHQAHALRSVRKGGAVVCGGIHMSDIPAFAYALLWGERRVQSVANLTRADGEQFMRIAAEFPLQVQTTRYALDQANAALAAPRAGQVIGAAVLTP